MDSIQDTPAGSMTRSSDSPDGNSLRRLERDAALLLETQIGLQSSGISESVMILMATLHGIVTNTTSGDVIALGVYQAKDMCLAAGVSEDVFEEVIKRFVTYSKKARSRTPLAY